MLLFITDSIFKIRTWSQDCLRWPWYISGSIYISKQNYWRKKLRIFFSIIGWNCVFFNYVPEGSNCSNLINVTSGKTGTHVPVFPLFLLRLRLKIMNGVFFIKFWFLLKLICCFQAITNQTNHDYLFQWHQYNKKI